MLTVCSYVLCRFHLWDAYGILPTVCGIKDKSGECTYAGIEADSTANCIVHLDEVVHRLKALKVIYIYI